MTKLLLYTALLLSASSATQFFGTGNIEQVADSVKLANEELLPKNMSISHVYIGESMTNNKEFLNFLTAANFTSGSAYDRAINASTQLVNNDIVPRDIGCTTTPKYTVIEELEWNACNALAGIAGPGGGGALGLVASGAYCRAAENGVITTCNLIWTFSGAAAGDITGGIVRRYCPGILAGIKTCPEETGVNDNGDYEMIRDVSQTQYGSCNDLTIPCTTISPG